jgi:hypothetical protein
MRRTLLLACVAVLVVGSALVPASAGAAVAGAVPRIAVVRSPLSDATVTSAGERIGTQFVRADVVASWLSAKFGAQNVVVVGDAELADANALSAFDVVVLTRQISMTTAQCWAMRQFVATGGGLVAMFGTARWDYVAGRRPPYIRNIELYRNLAWEWGEMSPLFGVSFFNDPLTASGYHIVGAAPTTHPILQGVAADLGRSAPVDLAPGRADYNEYVRILPGAAVTPLLYYSGASANGTPWNGSGWLAGWASQYENGRAVVFGFQLHDAGGALFAPPVETEVQAQAILFNSVKWAGAGKTYTPVKSVYRFYNKKTGTHFYTASETEKYSVLSKMAKTYSYEGVAYGLDTSATSMTTPLYRFFNKKTGTHFYTASGAEKDAVIARLSGLYAFEGVAYNVSSDPSGSTPVHRFFNKKTGTHFYTASEAEKANVIARLSGTYGYEGIGFYLGAYVPPAEASAQPTLMAPTG